MDSQPIRKVLIVGGGTAGWMAAAVLSRAFGPTLDIELVESEQIGIVGVGEATIPQIRLLNQYLGIDENEFLEQTQASFKLGIQFNGWHRPDASYMHAFGDIGRGLGNVPFYHIWRRGISEGQAGPLWDYSLNSTAASQHRFARLSPTQTEPLAPIHYAFHFDASLYAAYLRRLSERQGVRRVEGRVIDVRLDGETGHIGQILLDDDRTLQADLYIDCSGFRGLLIEQALKSGYEDWSELLPCDSALAVPSETGQVMRPFTESNATRAGWQWRIPLQQRVGNGHVYCSRFVSDDEAASILLGNLDGKAMDEPRQLRFVTGRRKQFWHRNCVALGLASGFMEPLESTSIHLIQSGISRLLSLFPDLTFDPALSDEYNRQTGVEYERIRDFLILHYRANGRVGEPFWDERRQAAIPERLSERMRLFAHSGVISRDADELFTEGSWLQVLLGQCGRPKRVHPLAGALDPRQVAEVLAVLRSSVQRVVEAMPQHAAYVNAQMGGRQQQAAG